MNPFQPGAADPGREQEKAWQSFFDDHYTKLCIVSYKIIGNLVTAEAVVAEVLDHYWPLRNDFPTPTDFSKRLYRATYYQSLTGKKLQDKVALAEKQFTELATEADIHAMDQGAEMAMLVEQTLAALNDLPASYQEVLKLHYLDGQKVKQIVQKTQKAQSTVSTLKKKALQLLRQELLKRLTNQEKKRG